MNPYGLPHSILSRTRIPIPPPGHGAIIAYFCYNEDMNILYCGDQGISRGVLVSVLSILKHNKGVLHFYIMTIRYSGVEPFSEKAARFLDGVVKKTNAKSFVKLIDATEVFQANLPKKNMGSYFTPCSMLRLYIDKVPELVTLDRVLYLD